MNDNSYFFLILGIIFVSVGLWMWKKDREQFKVMEDKLTQKENSIYELYESLEELMEEMDILYRKFLSNGAITDEFQNDKEQQECDKAEDDDYNDENNENNNIDIKIREEDVESIVIALKEEGASEEDIARQLGMGKGEVKLILDLKNDGSKGI